MKKILFAFLLVVVQVAGAQVSYRITDLGTLSPAAINNLGQIAAVNLNKHAVLWTLGRARDLGVLPGGTYSIPAGMNDLDAVVGVADGFISEPMGHIGTFSGYVPLSFIWTPSGGMMTPGYADLPPHDPVNTRGFGVGINIFGNMIGVNICCVEWVEAFSWTKAGGFTWLGGWNSEPLGINNRGQIVGWNGYAWTRDYCCYWGGGSGLDWGPRATLWDHGTRTELGSLLAPSDPFYSDHFGVAYGINDLSQIVGWMLYNADGNGNYVRHAFLWTQNDGLRDLGTLSGDLSSKAIKISALGQIIGLSYSDPSFDASGHPFLWTQQKGLQDLNTLIDPNSGWVLNSVADINFWGQIVGQGMVNGQSHGFLLTPRLQF